MSDKNYKEIAASVVENAGGIDNIIEVYHCMSRLRVRVKDTKKVNLGAVQKLGFTNAVLNGNQLQVIAGNDIYDLYDSVTAITGEGVGLGELTKEEEAALENLTPWEKVKNGFFAFFNGIAASVQPMIPVLIGVGVLMGLYLIFGEIGLLNKESDTYKILVAVCNAPFYFFPIFVGFNCAKQYGGNQMLGAFIGAILVHPTFVEMVQSGDPISFLSIPVRAVNYTSSVLPTFVSVYFMCKVEKWAAKISPKNVRLVLEPFLTVLIMVPLTLWILAPLGDYVSIIINAIVTLIHDVTGPFAPAIIASFVPFLVLTGTHSIIGTLAVPVLISTGKESIMMPGALLHNFNHAALALAIALKSKNEDIRSQGYSSSFAAMVGGISEPSLFGFFAKYRSAMLALLVGQFVSGLYCGITSTGIHAFPAGGPAFMSLAAFLGGTSNANFINACVAAVIGMAATFATAFFLYKDE